MYSGIERRFNSVSGIVFQETKMQIIKLNKETERLVVLAAY
jgi:hypothetical protein